MYMYLSACAVQALEDGHGDHDFSAILEAVYPDRVE